MSCFMVNDEHLCLLVQAANQGNRGHGNFSYYWKGRRYEIPLADFDAHTRVVRMLWAENARSVNYRYNDATDMIGESIPAYKTAYPLGYIEPVWVLKAIDCYSYQACETEDWPESEAWAFCDALRHRMISCLIGYDDAPTWEYSPKSLKRWQDERRKNSLGRKTA